MASHYDQQPGPHARKDSTTSSFFNPRPSGDVFNGQPERGSYYDLPVKGGAAGAPANADPEPGWDVYADFNNVGPRYSALKNQNAGYQPIGTPISAKGPPSVAPTQPAETPVELVTVPALGAEWRADELRAMTKQGRQEDKRDKRKNAFRAWNRDQKGCCGGWGTRKVIVWVLFGTCVVVGLALFFTIPRVPKFVFDENSPLVNSTLSDVPEPEFGLLPATFTFYSALNIEIDTEANYLPLHFASIHSEIYDIDTDKKVAEGTSDPFTLPAKTFTRVNLPITFNYTAANTTDATWVDVHSACQNSILFPDRIRPGLNLRVALYLSIAGLIGKPVAATTLSGTSCPFELPTDAP